MLACQVAGDTAAPLLFLTHGVTDSAYSLADAISRLSSSWYVVAIDSLGHGSSPRFTDEDLDRPMEAALDALRQTVTHYVDRYGPGFGLGHSMGGALLSRLAYECPELLRGIILEDPAWLTDFQAAEYRRHAASPTGVASHDDESVLAGLRSEYPNWPAPELAPWLQAKHETDERFRQLGIVGYVEPWTTWLADLAVPTAVLTSDQPDCVIGPDGIARIEAAQNPLIETVLLPGLRHVMRRDNPELFHEAVDSLLSRWKDA